MKVGYYTRFHTAKRNIINKVPGIEYVKVYDMNSVSRLLLKRSRREKLRTPQLVRSFNDRNLNRVDLLHLFARVSFGKTPWVASFSHSVPRQASLWYRLSDEQRQSSRALFEQQLLAGVEAVRGEACKNLIALSESSLKVQKALLQEFPAHEAEIIPKLVCVPPPQERLVESFADKNLYLDGQIRFCFVGRAFFRKGGMEILEAFKKAKQEYGYDIKLIIVSSLLIDNYAAKESEQDVYRAREIIDQNKAWIDYYEELPNARILELMLSSHVGLLPTYADTYGYSALEFQGCGCPVITTDIRALSGVNGEDRGWLIKLPKDHFGEAIYETEADRTEISKRIVKGLTESISEIMENRAVIASKGDAALKYLAANHSPETFAEKLLAIYDAALS